MKKTLVILFTIFSMSLICYTSLASHSKANDKPFAYEYYYDSEATSVSGSSLIVLPEDVNSANNAYIIPKAEYDIIDNMLNGESIPMFNNGFNLPFDHLGTSWRPATEIDLDPQSTTVFINKEYVLPEDYIPSDMVVPDILFDFNYYDDRKLMRVEASDALEELFAASREYGISLVGISAYRSYQRQYDIFTNNIIRRGKEHTLRYSAVPGTSEHQSGLCIDLSTQSLNHNLIDAFSTTPEGIWLSKNAYLYGYIIRYPEDKTAVTGYSYEPWHIRYVGKELASYLYKNDLTLEEYYNYTPSEGFDFERIYADILNYSPPVVILPVVTPPVVTPPVDDTISKDQDAVPPNLDDKKNDSDKSDSKNEELVKDIPKKEPIGQSEEQIEEEPLEQPIEQVEVTPILQPDEQPDTELDTDVSEGEDPSTTEDSSPSDDTSIDELP